MITMDLFQSFILHYRTSAVIAQNEMDYAP